MQTRKHTPHFSFLGITLFSFISLMSISHTALAGADCPEAPKDKWLSELDMQKKIVNEYGFSIQKFKIDGDCYEIYGKKPHEEKDGEFKRIEVYFNPVNGDIVKQKEKD
ncbi:MAG TPA: PepSY domain-containing protein [Thiothrix sp.]|nr:PepSY domain-containing protein [Thiothrix sp.]